MDTSLHKHSYTLFEQRSLTLLGCNSFNCAVVDARSYFVLRSACLALRLDYKGRPRRKSTSLAAGPSSIFHRSTTLFARCQPPCQGSPHPRYEPGFFDPRQLFSVLLVEHLAGEPSSRKPC